MGFFCGLMKFEIYFGMPDIPDIYIWVNTVGAAVKPMHHENL